MHHMKLCNPNPYLSEYIFGTLAALRRLPVDILIWHLDIARLAVNTAVFLLA